LLRRLDELAHLETDAMSLYAEAVNCARERNPEMLSHLEGFLGDHRRHAEAVASAIVRLGGRAPDEHFDPVGRFLHWPTMLHANPCREGAIEALADAEHYHNYQYAQALRWDVADAEVAEMLRAHAADEARHQTFMRERMVATA
jgi:hypothetical protein